MLKRKVQVWIYRNAPTLQVLLLKRAKPDKGEWHPVTGNVERHENVRLAAVRECQEEIACDVEPEPLGVTFTYEGSGRAKGRFHETVYAARVAKDDVVELSEEHTAHEWLTPAEAAARLRWPDQKKALDALVARYG